MTTATKAQRIRDQWPTLSADEAAAVRLITRDLHSSAELLILTCDASTAREDLQCYLEHQIHTLRRVRDAIVEHKDRYLQKMVEETA